MEICTVDQVSHNSLVCIRPFALIKVQMLVHTTLHTNEFAKTIQSRTADPND